MRFVSLLLVVVACGGPGRPADPLSPPPVPAAKTLVLVDDDGVGLGGHDPVAYLVDLEAVPGDAEHVLAHGGARYRFMSADHKSTFEADPDRHVPLYGGYCAFAASQNQLSEADPAVFQVIHGQLFVFTDASYKAQFNQDVPGNKAKADQFWPGLVERHGK
jgi:hypothetical protein